MSFIFRKRQGCLSVNHEVLLCLAGDDVLRVSLLKMGL